MLNAVIPVHKLVGRLILNIPINIRECLRLIGSQATVYFGLIFSSS
jgi:hypothetical protein